MSDYERKMREIYAKRDQEREAFKAKMRRDEAQRKLDAAKSSGACCLSFILTFIGRLI